MRSPRTPPTITASPADFASSAGSSHGRGTTPRPYPPGVNALIAIPALVQGLTAGIIALVILAFRAAVDGRPGPTFGDLWTSFAVGVAVGVVSAAMPRIVMWQVRRSMLRPGSPADAGQWQATFGSGRTPA